MIRDFIVQNFCISLKSIEYKDKRITNMYFLLLFRLIPFYFVQLFFNYMQMNYIYLQDDIYFSNYSNNKICPIIKSVELINNDNNKLDITQNIKKYSNTIPFWFIIDNEKYEKCESIDFTYFYRGVVKTNKINKNMLENMHLYQVF